LIIDVFIDILSGIVLIIAATLSNSYLDADQIHFSNNKSIRVLEICKTHPCILCAFMTNSALE